MSTKITKLFPDLIIPQLLHEIFLLTEPLETLPQSLKFSEQKICLKRQLNDLKTDFRTKNILKLIKQSVSNEVLLEKAWIGCLFHIKIKTDNQFVNVLNFCPNVPEEIADSFLERNKGVLTQFCDAQSVFQKNITLLNLKSISPSLQTSLQRQIATFITQEFLKLLKEYKSKIKEINANPELPALIRADSYAIVTQTAAFKEIKRFYLQFFQQNLYSTELASLLQGKTGSVASRFYQQLVPQFSLSKNNSVLKVIKNNAAALAFVQMTAIMIAEFYESDQTDLLLQGINKLRNEDLAVMLEQNLDQNDLVQKQIVTDKLSLCLQEPVCQFIENDNFQAICDYILNNYKADAEQILSNLNQRLSNSHILLPKFEKHGLGLFNKTQEARSDPLGLGLPLFVHATAQFQIENKKLQAELQNLFEGFVCFLADISPSAKLVEHPCVKSGFCTQLKNITRSEKVLENVKQSIKAGVYTALQMGLFLGTLFANQDVNLAPQCFLDFSTTALPFKQLYDDLTGLLPKAKKLLLKFLFCPQTLGNYSVQEQLIQKQILPVVDIFSLRHAQVRDFLANLALHLLLCEDDNVFLQIALDYEKMKDFQVAGTLQQVGGAYHYDCLIKDSVIGQSISYSIRKLQISSFRFFILLYCGLIFISSLVFGNYKSHNEYCCIISSFDILQQDRFTYLISQISNSLSVISNVKGFSERGALGFCNAVLFSLIQSTKQFKTVHPEQLEVFIEQINADQLLTEYCRIYNSFQSQESELQKQRVETQEVEEVEEKVQNAQSSPAVQLRLQQLEEDHQRFLAQDKVLGELQRGIKLIFKPEAPKKLQVGVELVKFAQKDPEMADFIRSCGKALADVGQLTREALVLKNYVLKQFDGKMLVADLETKTLHPAVIGRFIELYSLSRHLLLSIQNACHEQSFPEITEQITIGQLVLLGTEARDGQSRLSLLDEIVNSFCRIVNKVAVGEEVQVESYIDDFCACFDENFAAMLEVNADIESVARSISAGLRRVSSSYASLKPLSFQIVQADTYGQYCARNAALLASNPEFKCSEDEFDELYLRFDRAAAFQRLSEYMDGPIGVVEALASRKIDAQQYSSKQTVGDVLNALYGADNLEDEASVPFTQLPMLWSILLMQ